MVTEIISTLHIAVNHFLQQLTNQKFIFSLSLIFFFSLTAVHAITLSAEKIVEESNNIVPMELSNYFSQQNIAVTNNNDVLILKNGNEKFEKLFASIREATHHIHLEYFNFRNDSIANALFDLLSLKAKQGVKVRIMFDAFGNMSNNRPLKKEKIKDLSERGLEIVKFDPIRFPYINHALSRDHRKIAIIDGRIGYTGGMNVADYYINGTPKIGAWHDMHIRIEGDAVSDLQKIFLASWNKETKQHIGGEVYFPSLEKKEGKHIAIVERTPRIAPKQIRRSYLYAIRSAKEKIQIVNPYFLPTKTIKEELEEALSKGVKIDIMFSIQSDIPFTPEGSLYLSYCLMKKGANIYLYKGGFHHSKIMMVDDSFCTIGTTNLNSRSLRYDYEVNAFIFDKQITQQLKVLFEKDKASCNQMTIDMWKDRSFFKRAVGWTAKIFTPVL